MLSNQVSILLYSLLWELSLTWIWGWIREILKLTNIYCQWDKITSDAHYWKRIIDPFPLSCVSVFFHGNLVYYVFCRHRFFFTWHRHLLAIFWYPCDRKVCVIGGLCMYLFKIIITGKKSSGKCSFHRALTLFMVSYCMVNFVLLLK